MDSAKGWAGVIKFHPELTAMFRAFIQRSDTFSLGVCNGCQLMALLGWVPFAGTSDALQVCRPVLQCRLSAILCLAQY